MLPSAERLHAQADIQATYRTGTKRSHRWFRLYCRANQQTHHRCTVVVSKQTAKLAVQRNRLKRRLRASLKTALQGVATNLDVIVVAHAAAQSATTAELTKQLHSSLT